MEGIDMGSDHDVFREGTWKIPGLYLHDWPDRYIHTNFDTAAMIDPTKLRRAAFIGAVSAWFLANMSESGVPRVLSLLRRNSLQRSGDMLERLERLDGNDAAAVTAIHFDVERLKIRSIGEFAAVPQAELEAALAFIEKLEAMLGAPDAQDAAGDSPVYERNPELKGPMTAFGYSYLQDKYGRGRYLALTLPAYTGTHGSGGEYAYEALNLVDGQRTVIAIRNWLTAELGPVPLAYVSEYLEALESIGVVRRQR
jgi:hypothetical protein